MYLNLVLRFLNS